MVRKSLSSRSGGNLHGDISSESTETLSSITSTSSSVRHQSDLVTRMARLRRQAGASSSVMDEVQVLERMDTIRAAFVAFAKTSSSGLNDALICVAWYDDGSTDLLSEESLSKLGEYHNWRASITGLQAYVRPKQSGTGMYRRRNARTEIGKGHYSSRGERHQGVRRVTPNYDRRRGLGLSPRHGSSLGSAFIPSPDAIGDNSMIVEQESLSVLDCATADIAFVADMSYALPYATSSALGHGTERSNVEEKIGGESDPTSTSDQSQKSVLIGGNSKNWHPPWPTSRIRIARLEAAFIIDELGYTWFSHATRTLVQTVPRTEMRDKEREVKRQVPREETRLAASVAARELRALMQMASRRGLTAEEAFEHFDPRKKGHVSKIEIREGMASLGLVLSDEAAAELVRMVIDVASRHAKCGPSTLTRQARSSREPSGNCGICAVSTEVEVRERGSDGAKRKSGAEKSSNLRASITAADLWCFSRRLKDMGSNNATNNIGGQAERENRSLEHNQMGTGSDRDNINFPTENLEIQSISKRRRIGDKAAVHRPSTPSNGQEKHYLEIEPPMSSTRGLSNGSTKTGRDSAVNDHPTLHPNRASSGSMTGTKVGSSRSLFGDRPEVASFPCADPAEEAASGKDHVFHVDR